VKPEEGPDTISLNIRLFTGPVERWTFKKTTLVEVKIFYM